MPCLSRIDCTKSGIIVEKIRSITNASYLDSEGSQLNSKFFRVHNRTTYELKSAWIGGKISAENNQVKAITNDINIPIEALIGIGLI